MTAPTMRIGDRTIGSDHPMYIIAEVSANHNHDIDVARDMVREAARFGADAVKLQTYTPDTMTIPCDNEWFQIGKGTVWEGKNLHDLYGEAYTPWEWHEEIFEQARGLGMHAFSSPFDATAVEFLDALDPEAFKIASFEVVDLPLIECTAQRKRPMILSTGMAELSEIEDAVGQARTSGCQDLAVLRCNSAYPAPLEEMDLRTIPDMIERFGCPVGLSDHSLGATAALGARALGASILEKHFILDRSMEGPDSTFSTEPDEFKQLIDDVRSLEKSLGTIRYGPTPREEPSRVFRRSLFVVADVAKGEEFTSDNVRVIRPGYGMAPKHLDRVLGQRAGADIPRGTPLTEELLA